MAQINKPSEYFNTKLYTGTGSSNSVTGVGFQPDWVWIKGRSDAPDHFLFDAVRGVTNSIRTNVDSATYTEAQLLTAFGSDGFTVGTNTNVNASSQTFVAWNWLANGAGVSNTDGSITSTVSANTTSGFSIVTYTGTGIASGTETVGHGLGEVPSVVIQKRTGGTANWNMYHKSVGNTGSLSLNLTSATNTQTDYWGDTTPSDLVVTIGPNTAISGANVLYCFAEKKGFSKFGSYTGNGNADGTFVYTGFKPAFVIQKHYSGAATEGWQMWDTKRNTYNLTDLVLTADASSAEFTATARAIDILSNGFKCRGADNSGNASGQGYIYMAFAENPLVGTNNIPATAR